MTLFRSMIEDPDGLPAVGPSARKLGVRPGLSRFGDVSAIADDDMVAPGGGGMSVAPGDPRYLLPHRRPVSLGGSSPDPIWSIELKDLGADLHFRQSSPTHGVIEPNHSMTLLDFQAALAGTRSSWKLYCR